MSDQEARAVTEREARDRWCVLHERVTVALQRLAAAGRPFDEIHAAMGEMVLRVRAVEAGFPAEEPS